MPCVCQRHGEIRDEGVRPLARQASPEADRPPRRPGARSSRRPRQLSPFARLLSDVARFREVSVRSLAREASPEIYRLLDSLQRVSSRRPRSLSLFARLLSDVASLWEERRSGRSLAKRR